MSGGHTDHITVLGLDVSEGPTSGQIQFQTRLDIKEASMPADDNVEDLELCHTEELMLIRSRTTIVVYSFSRQRVANVIRRPGDVPAEFRLPGSGGGFVSLQFTQAHFSHDDKVRRSTLSCVVIVTSSSSHHRHRHCHNHHRRHHRHRSTLLCVVIVVVVVVVVVVRGVRE